MKILFVELELSLAFAMFFSIAKAFSYDAIPEKQSTSYLREAASYYSSVTNVTCESIRSASSEDSIASVKIRSNITFKRGGYLNILNVSPFVRRLLADGSYFYEKYEDDTFASKTSFSKLDFVTRNKINAFPISSEEMLYSLDEKTECVIEESSDSIRKVSYKFLDKSLKGVALLSISADGCVVGVEVFDDVDMKKLLSKTIYDRFEVFDGIRIALRHKTTVITDKGKEVTGVVYFKNVKINTNLPDSLFVATNFFDVNMIKEKN